MSIVVSIESLIKLYGAKPGVLDLQLNVAEGMLYGFLGPNGAGKTTTLRVLMGFLRPSGGAARVFGLDCWRESHRIKRDVGYLPGDVRLYPWLTARLALRLFGGARGLDLEPEGRVLLEKFELDPEEKVRRMSRGMRQKLGLIISLAHRPRLLILDEPTTALDPIMRERLCAHLRQLAAEGHTVIFSSHTLSEVEVLCDRVAILRRGRLVAEEGLDQLRERALREVTIHWRADVGEQLAAICPPQQLEIYERSERLWRGVWRGPAMELVRWSADLPIEDLSIGQPDLNRVFQRYYNEEAPER